MPMRLLLECAFCWCGFCVCLKLSILYIPIVGFLRGTSPRTLLAVEARYLQLLCSNFVKIVALFPLLFQGNSDTSVDALHDTHLAQRTFYCIICVL